MLCRYETSLDYPPWIFINDIPSYSIVSSRFSCLNSKDHSPWIKIVINVPEKFHIPLNHNLLISNGHAVTVYPLALYPNSLFNSAVGYPFLKTWTLMVRWYKQKKKLFDPGGIHIFYVEHILPFFDDFYVEKSIVKKRRNFCNPLPLIVLRRIWIPRPDL